MDSIHWIPFLFLIWILPGKRNRSVYHVKTGEGLMLKYNPQTFRTISPWKHPFPAGPRKLKNFWEDCIWVIPPVLNPLKSPWEPPFINIRQLCKSTTHIREDLGRKLIQSCWVGGIWLLVISKPGTRKLVIIWLHTPDFCLGHKLKVDPVCHIYMLMPPLWIW